MLRKKEIPLKHHITVDFKNYRCGIIIIALCTHTHIFISLLISYVHISFKWAYTKAFSFYKSLALIPSNQRSASYIYLENKKRKTGERENIIYSIHNTVYSAEILLADSKRPTLKRCTTYSLAPDDPFVIIYPIPWNRTTHTHKSRPKKRKEVLYKNFKWHFSLTLYIFPFPLFCAQVHYYFTTLLHDLLLCSSQPLPKKTDMTSSLFQLCNYNFLMLLWLSNKQLCIHSLYLCLLFFSQKKLCKYL